ncbi:phosphoenolpyruvate synthase [Marinimicrococcus flavescens]|uniref:Phosphoenolpyruvate synthase n=1 Tax=Marinimicrococcus flavescens TaxID=3031815 RepID=A0AAP3XR53_9PROT|nr:phosphoenolpyruvate synthase [Marinimicrococcus flavescens]
MAQARYVRWFGELGMEDVPLVGGKNASLGELYRELSPLGVRVPNGFALTAEAFREALAAAGVVEPLREALHGLDKNDIAALARVGARARELVLRAGLLPQAEEEIREAFVRLLAEYGPDCSVAVRSSATAEDLPTASFAGQHDTYLNVHGPEMLLEAVRRCQASLFTDRAISYRIDKGFDHMKVALSVGVQKMVRADLASAGVMFSIDTESGFADAVFITGSWGLGENVVQGAVDVDEFHVHKPTFRTGHRCVLRRRLGAKKVKMIYAGGRTREPVVNRPTSPEERRRFCLADEEVLELAGAAIAIEDHYSARAGGLQPMDMEWAKDGLDGKLYIVQARPETVVSQQAGGQVEEFVLEGKGPVLAEGRAVGMRIASGPARLVGDTRGLAAFRDGEVLVADSTTPDWEPVMKRAAAIVTNRGGRTCHAAIVARELGIPAVVGAGDATGTVPQGATVTVSCAEGEVGRVYEGAVPFARQIIDLSGLERPQTEVMINLGNPDLGFGLARLPADGVGLARLEFIISEAIRAHPMALLHPERVASEDDRRAIEALIETWPSGRDFFVTLLAEGVGTIAAAFWPRPVIVRLSDFKTNEYAALLGGAAFEPEEENPMLGFRGAARYAHPAYREAFAMECAAMRRVREEMGLENLKVMIPFCRRLEEADRVLEAMAGEGLRRGERGLEVYVMCEIPNNVILIDRFAERFDGFSIGSNDLTQLTLGVDRDSEMVAFEFDERDPGVMAFLEQAVSGAKRNGRHSGICGQAPSDYPEMAEFLVRCGIDSLSVTPDVLLRTLGTVREAERKLGREARKAG